jgi:hypothetical protein
MHTRRCRFRTQQVGGPDLNRRGAERERGRHAGGVGDPAGGNHRNAHGMDDLRNERKRADLTRQILRQKHPAVSARLETLRNDRVDAPRFKPPRFVDGRGRGEDHGPPLPDPIQQLR